MSHALLNLKALMMIKILRRPHFGWFENIFLSASLKLLSPSRQYLNVFANPIRGLLQANVWLSQHT